MLLLALLLQGRVDCVHEGFPTHPERSHPHGGDDDYSNLYQREDRLRLGT